MRLLGKVIPLSRRNRNNNATYGMEPEAGDMPKSFLGSGLSDKFVPGKALPGKVQPRQVNRNDNNATYGVTQEAWRGATQAGDMPQSFLGGGLSEKFVPGKALPGKGQPRQVNINFIDQDSGTKAPADSNGPKRPASGRLMTKHETFNMRLNRTGDPAPFCPLPRLSMPGDGDYARSKDSYVLPGDEESDYGAADPPEEVGERGDAAPQGEDPGAKGKGGRDGKQDKPVTDATKPGDAYSPKFRRNVPAYYKIFELNSRFFLSGLGIIILLCIIFNIIALICAVESDPNIHYRQVPAHIHIAFLAFVLLFLFAKYAAYFFNAININRRLEIASALLAIVVVITLAVYGHWLILVLPKTTQDAYKLQLPCGPYEDLDAQNPAAKLPGNQPQPGGGAPVAEVPLKVWYACGLIRHTVHAGVACIVFSVLLLLGLIANTIHAFLGIQNDVDITS